MGFHAKNFYDLTNIDDIYDKGWTDALLFVAKELDLEFKDGKVFYCDGGILDDQAKEDLLQLWQANDGDDTTQNLIMSVLECAGCSNEFKHYIDNQEA